MKVFLNPGHAPGGVPDPGACNPVTGLRESDVAAKIGALVRKYLEAAGCTVEMLQSNDLYEITSASNNWDADIFVSIHCNSVPDPSANGTECWHYYSSTAGRTLAKCIQKQIVDSLPVADRGTKGAEPGVNGLYVLTNTDAVACLVETAFISNPGDEDLLETRQDDFARAIARGITDFEQQVFDQM